MNLTRAVLGIVEGSKSVPRCGRYHQLGAGPILKPGLNNPRLLGRGLWAFDLCAGAADCCSASAAEEFAETLVSRGRYHERIALFLVCNE